MSPLGQLERGGLVFLVVAVLMKGDDVKHLLGIIASIYVIYQLIKESCEPTIPAANWANMDLWRADVIKGVPIEQRMKNLENGKYKIIE